MKISGAQIIIETLIEQGCDTVFGYPGGSVLNIYDELYKKRDRIHHILTAHEQGAAHAADGYARVSGKVGVVIAYSDGSDNRKCRFHAFGKGQLSGSRHDGNYYADHKA